MPNSEDVKALVARLLRGIASDNVVLTQSAWRGLLETEASAVPEVLAKLDSRQWEKAPVGPAAKYLGVLLAMLHELDEAAFKAEIDRLSRRRLNPLHRRTVELMAQRWGERPYGHLDCGVPVHISDEVADRERVFRELCKWSRTPGLAIATVTRIDVIRASPELSYLGLYRLHYGSIVLTRSGADISRAERRVRVLLAKMTFFHEVGHHHHGHKEGGQIEEQEREAEAYARAMFRNSNPVANFFIQKVLGPPLRPYFRARQQKLRNNRRYSG